MTIDLREQLQSSLGSAYTLERELGGGGMSRTYVAHEAALGRKVVVKVLSPELAAGVSVERFKREVLLAAKLQHPHIVPVLTSGDAGGLPWFTMPFVEGESLRHRLARGPLAIGPATGILRDVARALEFAHAHGIVHRDIKPDNVLLAGSSATVTDFGIAKAISAARTGGAGATLTIAGTSIGTPAYMAPEQAAGDPNTDLRSDLYAFGCVAYELLTGRPPFVATSAAKLLGAHLGERPRDVRELRPDTPSPLATLVMRCLEKEPDARPQEAADLVRVLDTVTSSEAGAAPAILGPPIRLGKAIGVWVAATALVALTSWAATVVIGLPDWVLPGSLAVMLAGVPAIVFTAWVQREAGRAHTNTPTLTPGGTVAAPGAMATLAMKASPHVSWRRTWLLGAIAVTSFVVLVVGFMVMRAFGIGPAASLIGAGKLGEGETLVIADFRSPGVDSTLGATIAEAIRTDLSQSSSLNVMSRPTVREILRAMQRSAEAPVTFEVAREIATREGAKAVLDGEVSRIGRGYVLSARLVSSIDGAELARFGRTADDDNSLIRTLGRLSRDVRGKIGESLKDIRDTKGLERVTTPSLAALRKYVEGVRLSDEVGDAERGLELLEEAVALDTAFAMAWRKISVVLGNLRTDRPRQMDAATRAFRHRERLSETERLLTEAYYYSAGPDVDLEKALAAYESLLELDPDNAVAANNAGILHLLKREYAKAVEFYRRALDEKRPFGVTFGNIMQAQLPLGDIAGLESTQALYRRRLPEHEGLWQGEWYIQWARRNYAVADSIARATYRAARRAEPMLLSAQYLTTTSLLQGRVRDALRWQAEGHNAVVRGGREPQRRLLAAIDSARMLGFFLGRTGEARQIVRRGLAATPPSSIRAAARPWDRLAEAAADIRDPELARQALEGFEQDIDQLGLINREGDRSRMRAWVAVAEGRAAEAVRDFREADRGMAMVERPAMIALADAFDLAGQSDSALAYYERFVAGLNPAPLLDGWYRAGAHKRAGELYEARGDTARAESHYASFVELWNNADPELQPRVREVRERLARLRRGRG